MEDLNALSLDALWTALVDAPRLRTLLSLARDEDLAQVGDVTSMFMVPPDARAGAAVRSRGAGVVAGLPAVPVVLEVFQVAGTASLTWTPRMADGEPCGAGDVLGVLAGSLRAILAVERTLLNLLGRLSGIATLTRCYAQLVAGTSARICETRKTTPGWRAAEKYAVRCGGGWLHRIGLHDAMLVKDNHIAGLSAPAMTERVAAAAALARSRVPLRFVEVEVDDLDQLASLLRLPAGVVDMILLDNMTPDTLRAAVAQRDASGRPVLLEASGGIDRSTVRAVAETGVDRISVGALTHSAPVLDLGLDIDAT
ncbi:MAG: carboxylating nicotinate-nucleotide diphosphorylase [Phycisphaerales bacterium]|nr:carboxylating nicotinate-nucleotide diphosphorylase [Phycisphaerales bacterium]